jgi:hypothetical protein
VESGAHGREVVGVMVVYAVVVRKAWETGSTLREAGSAAILDLRCCCIARPAAMVVHSVASLVCMSARVWCFLRTSGGAAVMQQWCGGC